MPLSANLIQSNLDCLTTFGQLQNLSVQIIETLYSKHG